MADVYRDGILYNTSKAIKNGQEYLFDWTMLNEYNSLQNYMGASQSDLKASIENKGVIVPDSATLDEYYTYVDQISGGGGGGDCGCGRISGIKTYSPALGYGGRVYDAYVTPAISWEEDGVYYGLCAAGYSTYSGDDVYQHVCAFKKTSAATDIQYVSQYGASIDNGKRNFIVFYAYRNGNNVRAFTFGNYEHATSTSFNYTQCNQFDWDIVNNTMTVTDLGHGTRGDYDPLNYGADLTGYSQLSGSEWVGATALDLREQYSLIYIILTLKGIDCPGSKFLGKCPVRLTFSLSQGRNKVSAPLQFVYGDYLFIGLFESEYNRNKDWPIGVFYAYKEGWTDFKRTQINLSYSVPSDASYYNCGQAGYIVGNNDITLWIQYTGATTGYEGAKFSFTTEEWTETVTGVSGEPGGNDGLFTSISYDPLWYNAYGTETGVVRLTPS